MRRLMIMSEELLSIGPVTGTDVRTLYRMNRV